MWWVGEQFDVVADPGPEQQAFCPHTVLRQSGRRPVVEVVCAECDIILGDITAVEVDEQTLRFVKFRHYYTNNKPLLVPVQDVPWETN